MNTASNNLWVVYLTLGLAVVLQLFCFSVGLRFSVPPLPSLVLIYWLLSLPHRFGLGTAFCLGVLLDVAQGLPLGSNVVGQVLVAYAILVSHQRLNHFFIRQQVVVIFIMLGVQSQLLNWMQAIDGQQLHAGVILLPAVIGAVCWPMLYLLLQRLSHHFQVN